jgi:hypothetical protein
MGAVTYLPFAVTGAGLGPGVLLLRGPLPLRASVSTSDLDREVGASALRRNAPQCRVRAALRMIPNPATLHRRVRAAHLKGYFGSVGFGKPSASII